MSRAVTGHLSVPAWLYPALVALLLLAALVDSRAASPGSAEQASSRPTRSTQALYLPLVGQGQPAADLASTEPPETLAYRPQFSRSALRLPFVAAAYQAAPAPAARSEVASLPAPRFLSGQVPLVPAAAPQAAPAQQLVPNATAEPAPSGQVSDTASCKVYPNVRITWYELGSCCGKRVGHPQYGITRSGLPVTWGMAAVQARWPLVPLGTRIIIKDLGADYQFVVTDTGSETAFGSSWVDIYAPTIPVGHWVERQVVDGRSDVLVCP